MHTHGWKDTNTNESWVRVGSNVNVLSFASVTFFVKVFKDAASFIWGSMAALVRETKRVHLELGLQRAAGQQALDHVGSV